MDILPAACLVPRPSAVQGGRYGFTTALNDQVVFLHPGKGVKTPPVAARPRRIITAEQYGRIHDSLPDEVMRLLIETDIESGLRWGEVTELRVKDLDLATGVLTVSRAVVQLTAKDRPAGGRASSSRTTPRTANGAACASRRTWWPSSAAMSSSTT